MLVIGLVGGMTKTRDSVAQQIISQDKKNIGAYSPYGDDRCFARAKELREIVKIRRGEGKGKALIIPHVLTLAEADYIREIGGYVWHMQGHKSCVVPIVRGDILVTHKVGGSAQYLDPREAFHQVAMSHHSRADVA